MWLVKSTQLIDATSLRNYLVGFQANDCVYFAPSFLDNQTTRIPVIHHCCDLLNRAGVEQAIQGADAVFHLARKQFQYLICNDKHKLNEQYKRDNLEGKFSLFVV